MGILTESIRQTLTIAKKIAMIYGEGGISIGPSHTLLLDYIVREKVLVNNITPEDVQTGFTNGHAVDQQIERAINFKKEE